MNLVTCIFLAAVHFLVLMLDICMFFLLVRLIQLHRKVS